MFEADQVMQDPYYLYMQNALEQVCFTRGIETTPLFRDKEGNFSMQSEGKLDGIFAIGSFTWQEIRSFQHLSRHVVFVDSSPDDEQFFSAVPNFHLGVLRALDEAGVSIPDQISLIAFNDTPLSQNATPPLSSVRVLQQEPAVAAMTAIDLSRSGAQYPFRTVVPRVFVDRRSVAKGKKVSKQEPRNFRGSPFIYCRIP